MPGPEAGSGRVEGHRPAPGDPAVPAGGSSRSTATERCRAATIERY